MPKLIVALAIILIPTALGAHPIQGVGAASCAQFAEMYQASPDTIEREFFHWAQGLMSGLNLQAEADGKPRRDLAGDVSIQKRTIRDYCANNPLKIYMNAVISLFVKQPLMPENLPR